MDTVSFKNHQKAFLDFYRSKGKSENSLKCYRLDFNCLNDFLQHSNKTAAVNFDQQLTQSFEHFLSERYPNINSIRRKLQTMRLFFDYLVERKLIMSNPIKAIQSSPKVLYPPTLHPIQDIEQIQVYLAYKIKNSASAKEVIQNYRNYILFLIIYHAGLSVSQLANLKKDHFLGLGENQDHDFRILISNSKKKDPYSVPMPADFKPTFERYFELLNQEMIKDEYFFDQVFFNSNAYRLISGGISARGLEDIFNKISQAIKIEITPKSLRQTAILRWLNQQHSPATIKEWLGVAPAYNMNLYFMVMEKSATEGAKLHDLKAITLSLP